MAPSAGLTHQLGEDGKRLLGATAFSRHAISLHMPTYVSMPGFGKGEVVGLLPLRVIDAGTKSIGACRSLPAIEFFTYLESGVGARSRAA